MHINKDSVYNKTLWHYIVIGALPQRRYSRADIPTIRAPYIWVHNIDKEETKQK